MPRFTFAYSILLAGLTVLLTWPLAAGLDRLVIDPGDPLFMSWVLAWDGHALTTDPARLFHANIFHPHQWTLAFSEHGLGQALLVLPLQWAGAQPILIHNIALWLTFPLSGLCMFLLARDLTGDRRAAALAGIGFAFSAYRFGHLGNLALLSMQGLPLCLLGMHRAVEQGRARDWALAGGGFLIVLLTSAYNTYLCIVAGVVFLAWWIVSRRGRIGLGALGRGAAAAALTAAAALPLVYPYWKARSLYGFVRDTAEADLYSARLTSYLAAAPCNRWLGDLTATLRIKEGALFPGAAVLALALCAILLRRGPEAKPARAFYALLALVAVWCSLGPHVHPDDLHLPSLYRGFAAILPGFDAMRVPARFGMLAGLALAVLAAYGAAALFARLGGGRRATLCALALGAAAVAENWSSPIRFRGADDRPDDANRWLAIAPSPGAVVHLPVFDATRGHYETRRMLGSTAHWRPLVNGYSGFTPPGYYEQAQVLNRFPAADALDLMRSMGVRYVVVHWEFYQPSEQRALAAAIPPDLPAAATLPRQTIFELTSTPWP